MQYLQIKNKKIINRVYKEELKRMVYKSIFFNTKLDSNIRQESFIRLSRLTQSGSISYLKPRCFWTNNSRAVLTFFKVSRFKFRMLASYGYIPGVKKSSW